MLCKAANPSGYADASHDNTAARARLAAWQPYAVASDAAYCLSASSQG
jgi:hypothetical protein